MPRTAEDRDAMGESGRRTIETLARQVFSICQLGPCVAKCERIVNDALGREYDVYIITSEDGSFELSTRRGKQFNSMVQRNRDPLTGAERDHIFVSRQDAGRMGLSTNDRVIVSNQHGEFRGRAFVTDAAPGTLQGHWPELLDLIPPGRSDAASGIPDYNATVTLRAL